MASGYPHQAFPQAQRALRELLGHDFRPDYLTLPAVIAALRRPRGAGADRDRLAQVRREIVDALKMTDPAVIVGEFDRPDIWLGIRLMTDTAAADTEILQALQDNVATGTGAAIVYVASRRRSEELAEVVAGRIIGARRGEPGQPT